MRSAGKNVLKKTPGPPGVFFVIAPTILSYTKQRTAGHVIFMFLQMKGVCMFSLSKKLTAIILAVALSIPCMNAYAAGSTAAKY